MTRCPSPVRLRWMHLGGARGRSGTMLTPCRRWACDHCGRGKRAEALKLIRAGVAHGLACRRGQPLRLVTLTYPAATTRLITSREDVLATSLDWRRFVQAWRRHGHEMQYLRVLERTKRGRLHIHAITWGDYIPKCSDKGRRARGMPTGRGSGSPCYCDPRSPCIQSMAWAAGFGWADVRVIRDAEAGAAYVAKYLGKQNASGWWPRYARRIAYSRGFTDGLTLGRIHAEWVDQVKDRLRTLGAVIEEIPPDAIWTRIPMLPVRLWAHPPPSAREARFSMVSGARLPEPF